MVHLRNELLASATAYSAGLSALKSSGSSSQALKDRSTDTFSQTLHQLDIDRDDNDLAHDTESGRTFGARQNPVTESSANSETEAIPIPAYLIGFNALVPRRTVATKTAAQTDATRTDTFSQTSPQLDIGRNGNDLAHGTESGRTVATRQDPVAESPASSVTESTPIPADLIGFNALVPRYTVAATTTAPTAATTTNTSSAITGAQIDATLTDTSSSTSSSLFPHWYADNAADDAYWSQQPAAVQQLREIQDPEQRAALASTLSSEGYTIDNAIMVWGWDAGQVIAARQADGYTWVPSAAQANVTAAPGLTGAGITPYDPTSPPPGSIAVPAATTTTTPAMS